MTAPPDALPISDAEVEAACAEYDALGPATDRGLMRQALAAALAVRAQATELPPLPIGEAEVLWFDPQLRFEPEQAGKIIDASIAFMDAAPLGTKLYTVEQMRQYALDAQAVRAVPADFGVCMVDAGFRFDRERQQHVPNLLVEFEPVPVNGGVHAKGWADRNALAKFLRAQLAPEREGDEK
ncbi:MAG: hypothetical protein KA200_00205 [Burkholderiales bacterium]|nr:hypothetical protein [Burkholderiales bacterium]